MTPNFLLSVVVPTKNRQFYAKKCVQSILSIQDERIEIVVQDNSDDETLRYMLEEFSHDVRLKYNYNNGIFSFIDNFNMAIDHAVGDYVLIIGDDDGINPEIINIVEWAKINNLDAIKPELIADYVWPLDNNSSGIIEIKTFTAKCKYFNPRKEVIKLIQNGFINYLIYDLAKLYHGIIKNECLKKVKKVKGNYFGGLTPDIYSAMSLSLIVNKAVKIDYPLTIAGYCSTSGTAEAINGKHTGELNSAPHFKGHKNYIWNDLVPKFYSVETIWAVTAIEAVGDFEKKLLKKYNIIKLFRKCSTKYPEYSDLINNQLYKLKKNRNLNINFSKLYFIYLKNFLCNKIINFSKKLYLFNYLYASDRGNTTKKFSNVDSIIEAMDLLQKRTLLSKPRIDDVLKNLDKLK